MLAHNRIPKQPVLESAALRRVISRLPSLLTVRNHVLTNSGRSAILLGLQHLGVRGGDRVLVPTYHCPSLVAPAVKIGALPAFYGLRSDGLPDLDKIGDVRSVRAMIVAHLFGLPRAMDEVLEFCRRHNIRLIEDCAHCFFGVAGSRGVGTIGDVAIGSLPKFFPVPQGGILVSERRSLANVTLPRAGLQSEIRAIWDTLDMSVQFGRARAFAPLVQAIKSLRASALASGGPAHDELQSDQGAVDTRELMDLLLEPVACRQIESLLTQFSDQKSIVLNRQKNYRYFAAGFGDLRRGRALTQDCGDGSAPYVFPLLLDEPDGPYKRMRGRGLPVFRWDRLWPGTPQRASDFGWQWSRHVVQISCHQSLSSDELAEIVTTVRECVDS